MNMDRKLYASLQYKYFVRHHLIYRFINNILDKPNEKVGMSAATFRVLPFKRYLEKFDIGNAFNWCTTKEGVDFWLHHKDNLDEEIRTYKQEHNISPYYEKYQ